MQIEKIAEKILDKIAEDIFYKILLLKYVISIEIAKRKGKRFLEDKEILKFIDKLIESF